MKQIVITLIVAWLPFLFIGLKLDMHCENALACETPRAENIGLVGDPKKKSKKKAAKQRKENTDRRDKAKKEDKAKKKKHENRKERSDERIDGMDL